MNEGRRKELITAWHAAQSHLLAVGVNDSLIMDLHRRVFEVGFDNGEARRLALVMGAVAETCVAPHGELSADAGRLRAAEHLRQCADLLVRPAKPEDSAR